MTDTDPNKEQGERPASNQTAAADRSGATEGEKSAPASPPQESMTPERGETSGRGEQASQPRKPQIGDTRPAPANAGSKAAEPTGGSSATGPSGQNRGGDTSSNPGGSGPGDGANRKRRRRRGRGGSGGGSGSGASGSGRRGVDGTPVHSGGEEVAGSGTARGGSQQPAGGSGAQQSRAGGSRSGNSRGGNSGGSGSGGNGGGNRANPGNSPKAGSGKGGQRKRNQPKPVAPVLMDDEPLELDEQTLKRRSGKSRKGRAVGRYQMNVHVSEDATQISILEGRALLEHYVSRPSDDIAQIHGNIYVGKVENVLPGMEAAFVDISTPKNAVLYRGDVQYDQDDVDQSGEPPRIEDVLKAKQLIVCQVTKNPIAHKGARLTQEVSLPGRFVVLVPNSKTYGISKRLADDERKRLRKLLDRIKPEQHGVIVRTAASGVTTEEIERDVARLVKQWDRIEALAAKQNRPSLLYREPELAVRFIREEFNSDYRAVMIDDHDLFVDIKEYVEAVAPALADRVQFYDRTTESLPLFEKFHISEQLTKALDRKVWLPSGGSLIIEATEALTVIDVNTGRNVGSSSLEETVFKNNLEAAEEIAHQLRLRDIGGIIVIDFVDMEVKENRDQVVRTFRDCLSRDKTRTQVFNISELGLVEMTRKRIGEGLLESIAVKCEVCDGRGRIIPKGFGH